MAMLRADFSLRRVVLFYALAFAISWLIEIPQAAAARGLIDVEIPAALGFVSPLAPMLAAIVLSARAGGRLGVGKLLRPLLRWQVAWYWYVVALLMFPILALLAVSISAVAGGGTPDFSNAYVRSLSQLPSDLTPWLLLPPFLLFSLLASAPEEVGWRGFALPRLQRRLGAIVASLVVGVMWGLWHLPLFFQPASAQSGISFPLFFAGTLVTSILFTWVFNGTGRSLLLVSLLHSSFNASNAFLPLLPQVTRGTLQISVFLIIVGGAALILAVSGRLEAREQPPHDETSSNE
jgi:membrane protease YdiL (CAAX protease family)